jgi:hypothetical protein
LAPNRESAPPSEYGPWTGKTPVVVEIAVCWISIGDVVEMRARPRLRTVVARSRAVYRPAASFGRHVAVTSRPVRRLPRCSVAFGRPPA